MLAGLLALPLTVCWPRTVRRALSPHILMLIPQCDCHLPALTQSPLTPHFHKAVLILLAELNLLAVYKQQREDIMGAAGTGRIRVPHAPPARCALKVKVPTLSLSGFLLFSLLAGFVFVALTAQQAVSRNKTVSILLTVYIMKSQYWNETRSRNHVLPCIGTATYKVFHKGCQHHERDEILSQIIPTCSEHYCRRPLKHRTNRRQAHTCLLTPRPHSPSSHERQQRFQFSSPAPGLACTESLSRGRTPPSPRPERQRSSRLRSDAKNTAWGGNGERIGSDAAREHAEIGSNTL